MERERRKGFLCREASIKEGGKASVKKTMMVWILILLCGLGACSYSDESEKAPDNWPTYAVGSMTFPCEAGWTAADVSTFEDAAAEPFSLLETTNHVEWVGCIASPEWTDGSRNYLAISYLQMSSNVTDSMMEEQVAQLANLRTTFLTAGMTTTILTEPQMVRYGDHTVLIYSCRFTLEDGDTVIVQVGMIGHGDRLYQFHYVDSQSSSQGKVLAQILTGLSWLE